MADADTKKQCVACGGPLATLVDVPSASLPRERFNRRTTYLRCETCGQIQIVEED